MPFIPRKQAPKPVTAKRGRPKKNVGEKQHYICYPNKDNPICDVVGDDGKVKNYRLPIPMKFRDIQVYNRGKCYFSITPQGALSLSNLILEVTIEDGTPDGLVLQTSRMTNTLMTPRDSDYTETYEGAQNFSMTQYNVRDFLEGWTPSWSKQTFLDALDIWIYGSPSETVDDDDDDDFEDE